MAGAGFGIDATCCRPALDPADCRRCAYVEKTSRLARAHARLHDRQYTDPKVLGVSLRHRRPPSASGGYESDLRAQGESRVTLLIHTKQKPL